jgi:succinate-semialdehyde dehydrogenase/glutarate-semialdehyde dehydrogenase
MMNRLKRKDWGKSVLKQHLSDLLPEQTLKTNPLVGGVCCDSRLVLKNDIFVAIDGVKEDGIRYIADAIEKGATLLCGGAPHDAGELYYQPTLLTEMSDDMLVKQEETFGPVAGMFRFKTEDEVIAKANDTQYGLASYFYTQDLGQMFRVSEALEYGMVAVNEPVVSGEAVPFGGVKESGIGREGSKYGIDDFTEIKYTLVGGISQA